MADKGSCEAEGQNGVMVARDGDTYDALNATMDWIEAFALLPFEQPLIWLLLWPAPSLYAWAEGDGWKGLYGINLLVGWFPPFWLFTWWFAIFPPMLERGAAKLKPPEK